MAISSAMYTAVTGLSALGTGMQTISNNIANVNTVGFKAGRTNYEDLISQNYFSGGRVNQRGCGVKVSSIQSMFTQGAFMSSAQDTDMAIAGDGFFSVRNAITNTVMYTRAGNFTLNKDGYIEDPSGNILQGWQMSIPKPGQEAVRIGAPTDVKITVLNAPPVETSQMRVVVNLDSTKKTSYVYDAYEMAAQLADEIATPIAEAARAASAQATWNPSPAGSDTPIDLPGWPSPAPAGYSQLVTPSNKAEYNDHFMANFNAAYGVTFAGPIANMRVVDDTTTISSTARAQGWMTKTEYDDLITRTTGQMEALAIANGQAAYDAAYKANYELNYNDIILNATNKALLEGNGFAGAWDAREKPYIDTSDGQILEEPMIIYDSLGNEHKLMVYYQKNPYMEQVWDYIITCDPLEDARWDGNRALLLSETASFSGLIQKGKITFTADGDDRHGGVIKDIEAQNIDLNNSLMALIDRPAYLNSATTSTTMKNATIGGYYTGPAEIVTSLDGSFKYVSSARTYQLAWGSPTTPGDFTGTWKAVGGNPPASGLTWWDDAGHTGFIPISDPSYAGPYTIDEGLTITFETPMQFGTPGQDGLTVTAHSEQVAWTNLEPNKQGYYDFEVAFVESASLALHPPYPTLVPPSVTQTIAFDMGAKRNFSNKGPKWTLDDQSTTQYASKFSTVFAGQDGYPAGSLQRVSVGEDGVITGIYTNGRHQPLYQVGLTRFLNPWGLSKEGDNLFAETRYSGLGVMNEPGYGGTGTILGNFLEQSNVDLADEIVNMIITQRGFQANSKTVTTTDTMLAEIIEMKR